MLFRSYDLDQGNRIVNPPYITEKMAIRFFSMFWGKMCIRDRNEQITQNDVALEDADVMDGYIPTSDYKERRREWEDTILSLIHI